MEQGQEQEASNIRNSIMDKIYRDWNKNRDTIRKTFMEKDREGARAAPGAGPGAGT